MVDKIWFMVGVFVALTVAAKIVGKCFKLCLLALFILILVGLVSSLIANTSLQDLGSKLSVTGNCVSVVQHKNCRVH